MASIAYITDQKMIEFHRLNGNTDFIFWRPTSQKKFSNFAYGDYLFFLAKGTEKGRSKEKGIVGYGKLKKEYGLEFKDMWKKFKTKNGYASENQLHEAIKKAAKKNQLPNKLHCLELDSVIFFQTPVYLSELGIQISKQIESYTYLDQDNVFTSSKIIQKASTYGKDMWTSMLLNHDDDFKHDADLLLINNISQKYANDVFTEYEQTKYTQFTRNFMKDELCDYLSLDTMDFYYKKTDHIEFYIPCMISIQSSSRNILYYLGKYELYASALMSLHSESNLFILFDKELDENLQELLTVRNIKYICFNNKDTCTKL